MKVLIIYYSKTKNTKTIAEQIKEQIIDRHQIDLYEISEKKPFHFLKLTFAPYKKNYFSSVIGSPRLYYNTIFNKTPPLKNIDVDFNLYDLLIIGSPIWYGRCPPAMNSFFEHVEKIKLNKKTIFYVTSGAARGNEFYINVIKNKIGKTDLNVIYSFHKINGSYLKKNEIEILKNYL